LSDKISNIAKQQKFCKEIKPVSVPHCQICLLYCYQQQQLETKNITTTGYRTQKENVLFQ